MTRVVGATLVIKQTPHTGCGVFTDEELAPDAAVLRFRGPRLSFQQLDPEGHHDLQVGPNVYIGASHSTDDFVNHSCAPNCRVEIRAADDVRLVALRRIRADEEITFDYSTTSTEDERTWSMRCLCGARSCRGTISGFGTLSKAAQARCIDARMVPQYVLEALSAEVSARP